MVDQEGVGQFRETGYLLGERNVGSKKSPCINSQSENVCLD